MNSVVSWDEFKLVLAIARAGSLSGAGRALGASHATVFRRLNATEAKLGVELFQRRRDGYVPTQAGEEMAATAQRMERDALEVERRVVGRDLRPSGTVRVTTTDTLLTWLLADVFAAFHAAYPDIELAVSVSNQIYDLSRREADAAIRPASAPAGHLVGRRIATIALAVYGRADRAAPAADDLAAQPWVGALAPMFYQPAEDWMARIGAARNCRYRLDSVSGMHAAVRSGSGLAVLPCYVGDADPALQRLSAPIPECATDLWLLTHADLRKTARVRAFLDHAAEAVALRRDVLAGTASRAPD
mgnify:CR=1 FL=1